MKKNFVIKEDYIDSRIDRWIRKTLKIPQSLIEKNIRKGNILLNGRRVKSSHKVTLNDKVDIINVAFKENVNKKIVTNYRATKKDLSTVTNFFIDDNEDFSIINKPAGLAVQSGTKSIRNILDILKSTSEFSNKKPYCVHRIDKETTGILVVAKNRKFAQLFTSLFRIRKIHKVYLGIVVGEFNSKKGILTDELIYNEGKNKIKSKAITRFTVLDSNNNYSLLKLEPITGRKHQLRKQLLIHGHPIIGDTKYRLTDLPKNKDNYY